MPTISIVTATFDADPGVLAETAAAVADLRVPHGWDVEWLVQQDGPAHADTRAIVSQLPNAAYEPTDAKAGIPGTRNLALSRARGELVRTLDHDDLLAPEALQPAIAVMAEVPDVGWHTSDAVDLVDGHERTFACAAPDGRIPRHRIVDHWLAYREIPVHCASLVARRDLLLRAGGWMGSPRSEDVGLLLALSADADGWHDHVPTFRYRISATQTTQSAWWQALQGKAHRLVTARAEALRAAREHLA